MPKILALDTTSEFGSLALADGGQVVDEVLLHAPEGFGQILFQRVERLLERNGWKLADIDCFAGASGPGSFTGVRVGLAALKGLAEAQGKPAVAVSNLKAIASFGGAPGLRAVFLDARRGQIYGAVYDAQLAVISPETTANFGAWLAGLPEGNLELLSTNFAPFVAALAGTRFEHAPRREAPRALAAAIARIARLRLDAGQAEDPASIDANYVRRSDAELYWKDGTV
jgi:tRNA threonylcarbamoyladenosine biosynthesis protein TsaB